MRTILHLRFCAALALALGLGCESDPEPAAGDAGVNDGGAGASVVGTLMLPGTAAGKPWQVRLLKMAGSPSATVFAQATGVTSGNPTLAYQLAAVPAGTYFVLAFVDVDASGGDSSTPGDYAGWYGHAGDGNPPSAPSAVVPASGTVRFDFALVQR